MKNCKLSLVSTAALMLSLMVIDSAEAYENRVSEVPSNPWNCQLCHVSQYGAGARTVFGEDVKDSANGFPISWETLCELDSDDDGVTNGVELGDPSCTWRDGDPQVEGTPTDPNDPTDFPIKRIILQTS